MQLERKFVTENIRRQLLKEYLIKSVERAGFGGVEIQRTPMGTRITIGTERPGLIIGKKGSAIKTLTDIVNSDFKYDNPQIEVEEIENPDLNPQIMAGKLASALERGWHFRRAGHSIVQRIMAAGAKGCRVMISGKLTGERHKSEKFVGKSIKYCGECSWKFVKHGFAQANLKPGVIGVTVEIMLPDAKLPDEIKIKELAPPAKPEVAMPIEVEPEKVPALDLKRMKKLRAEIEELGEEAPLMEPAQPDED
jgi:small subunit ribosomal protein S3